MTRFGSILSSLSLTGGQSVRRNAGDTDWEAFTPSVGGSGIEVAFQTSGTVGQTRDRTTGTSYQYNGTQIFSNGFFRITDYEIDLYENGTYVLTLRDLEWNIVETIDTVVHTGGQESGVNFTPASPIDIPPGYWNLVVYESTGVQWDDNNDNSPLHVGAGITFTKYFYGNSLPPTESTSYSAAHQLTGQEGRLTVA